MDKLQNARLKIDEVDKKIAALFEERMQAVGEVAAYKKENGMAIFDAGREAMVIEKNSKLIQNPELKSDYAEFMKGFMNVSKRYQRRLLFGDKVGYQGVKGAFSHITSSRLFPDCELESYSNFEAVIEAVEKGEVEVGVLPIENSTTGEVGDVMDLLFLHKNVYINGYYDLEVKQNLLVLPGTKMEDIKTIYSHPQAISQVTGFTRGKNWQLIPYPNTAMAASFVAETKDKSIAAIASKETAELYGLEVLEENIQNMDGNTTRFALITTKEQLGGQKFGFFFTVPNVSGALAKAIDTISASGYNMTCLRSRSMKNLAWEYYFYAEITDELVEEKTVTMLEELKKSGATLRVLGGYTKVE